MLPSSWWICMSLKRDSEITNFTLPKWVELFILFKWTVNNMPHIFLFVLKHIFLQKGLSSLRRRRARISGRIRGLACFVRCFTLSFCSHKTPWTWEKTNYSFRRRCPGVFLSLSRPPRVHYLCSTGLAVTWELSLVGPLRPRLLLWTWWPSLWWPVPWSKEQGWVHTQHPWP